MADAPEAENASLHLHLRLSRLGTLLERMERRMQVVEQENTVLRSCLEECGALRSDLFRARLHQRRFLDMLRAHPCNWDTGLADIMLTREMRTVIGKFAGWADIRRCGTMNRSHRDLVQLVPHMMYVCGGFDGHEIMSSMERFIPGGVLEDAAKVQSSSPSSSLSSSLACFCGRGGPRESEHGSSSSSSFLGPLGIFTTGRGSWESVAPMAQRRAGFAAGVIDGVLYVCGGYDGASFLSSAERYLPDPGADSWEALEPMTRPRHCAAAASHGGRLYVCGGFNGDGALGSCECYDPTAARWIVLPPMVTARHGAMAASVAGALFVCGGYDGKEVLSSVERCDLASGGFWEASPPMLEPRNVAYAVARRGRLYVGGGCDGTKTLTSTESFDPVAGSWEPAPPMQQPRHGSTGAVAFGQLFVCGGGDSADASGRLLSSVERLNPYSNEWEASVPMRAPRIDMVAVAMFAPA